MGFLVKFCYFKKDRSGNSFQKTIYESDTQKGATQLFYNLIRRILLKNNLNSLVARIQNLKLVYPY